MKILLEQIFLTVFKYLISANSKQSVNGHLVYKALWHKGNNFIYENHRDSPDVAKTIEIISCRLVSSMSLGCANFFSL